MPQPAAVQSWGQHYDVAQTSEGFAIVSRLGFGSGFAQEYISWAPSVGYLVDIAAFLATLVAHPSFDDSTRKLVGPIAQGLTKLARQQLGLLDVHRLHAQFKDTPGEHVWRVAHFANRLEGEADRLTSETIKDTVKHWSKQWTTSQLKATAKDAVSGRGRGRGRGRSDTSYRGRGGRQSGRGRGSWNSEPRTSNE